MAHWYRCPLPNRARPARDRLRDRRGKHKARIARAKTKIGLANLVYNIKRLLFLRRIAAA
jgi:hypothetical protein